MSPPLTIPEIGAVSYLNSKPLIEGLRGDNPNSESSPQTESMPWRLTLDYPSRLADSLADGRLDVGLIPAVEVFRNAKFQIFSDACVATRGPVWSVKLYSRRPICQIERLALDEGSRTSAALTKVLLAERFGIAPKPEPFLLGQSPEESTADAILMIGDRAMHPPREHFPIVWDLGEEWTAWTGLPFVFAVWAVRMPSRLSELELDRLEAGLEAARDRGLSAFAQIADREADALGLDAVAAENYLRNNLHFRLGPDERAGLTRFHELTQRGGLVPRRSPDVFRHYAHS